MYPHEDSTRARQRVEASLVADKQRLYVVVLGSDITFDIPVFHFSALIDDDHSKAKWEEQGKT